MQNKKLWEIAKIVGFFLLLSFPIYGQNQDVIAMERAYFLKMVNQTKSLEQTMNIFDFGWNLREGSADYHLIMKAHDKDWLGEEIQLTILLYVTGCWLWPDRSYNPYSKETSYAGRLGTNLTSDTPIGTFRLGFYWQNWALSKAVVDSYPQYQKEPNKQWDFHYFFSYSIRKDFFQFDTIWNQFYKQIEPAIWYLEIFRTSLYYIKHNDDNNQENEADNYGIRERINWWGEMEQNNRYLLLDVSLTEPKKNTQRSYNIDKYTYRLESFGFFIPYIYMGCWYNQELGFGYGLGVGVWEQGQDVALILKWNEIQADPIFGKTKNLTMMLRGLIIF